MNTVLSRAILGSADGVVSIAGVVAGGAAAHVAPRGIALTALGGAAAATVSMAGAEWLSESQTDWGAVGAMGAGTLLGGGLPGIPLLVLGGTAGWATVILVSLVIGVLVGVVRASAGRMRVAKAVLETLGILALGAGVGYVIGVGG